VAKSPWERGKAASPLKPKPSPVIKYGLPQGTPIPNPARQPAAMKPLALALAMKGPRRK